MKQSIQLRLGQSLTMTPQLQQAIRLLQLSTLDLQMEIRNILESNMMLEVEEDNENESTNEENDSLTETENKLEADAASLEDKDSLSTAEDLADETLESALSAEDEAIEYSSDATDSIPEDLPIDSSWEDTYDGSTSYSQPSHDGSDSYEAQQSEPENLQDHLQWQLQFVHFSDTDQAIALAIIDSIDDDGYLHINLEELGQGLHSELDDDTRVEVNEIEAVLHRIQNFDPAGVGARNLGECLLIQLHQYPEDTPLLLKAEELIAGHLDLLGNRDLAQLMRKLKVSECELNLIISLIQSLNPRPGSLIAGTAPEYIIPDLIVKKHKGKWRVELNPDTMPKIRVNSQYANLIRRNDNGDENNCLKDHLQEARWFLKSLQSRNETLLKVGTCIVERQRKFLEYGEEAMKPLVLREIAEIVEMHESTISRVTTQKYMHTPRGIYEFKYFFSSHVSTNDGGECSSIAIRSMIKKLIAAENPAKPLSDSKIAGILVNKGVQVARRTVAKYREAMSITPSNERKRFA
ncbi:MAG: RNA polymerase factor sigma-54 [Gammaproteobacteria bacterium]|nr:RNA polymerase factor sigma-54 [Gammaproteobacteria bacterium]